MTIQTLPELHRRLRDQGWKVEHTNGGHFAYLSPQGKKVIGAATPSDFRAIKNTVSRLSREGFDKIGTRASSNNHLHGSENPRLALLETLQDLPGPLPGDQVCELAGVPGSISILRSLANSIPEVERKTKIIDGRVVEMFNYTAKTEESVSEVQTSQVQTSQVQASQVQAVDVQAVDEGISKVKRRGRLLQDALEYLKANPGKWFTAREVCEAIGVPKDSLRIRERTLASPNLERMGANGHYKYRWVDNKMPSNEFPSTSAADLMLEASQSNEITPVPVIHAPTISVPTSPALRFKNDKLFEYLTDYPDGRLVLRDENGEIWLADRMVPTTER